MKSFPGQMLVCSLLLALTSLHSIAAAEKANVNVILWFDTEDYLLPADDDATKRLAQMLTDRGIPATFKIVGEKARALERRGRRDVIAALKKHDIGYHANFHSVHPAPSEYLADCGLLDGMAEFARREGGGAADVRRICGVRMLACYGQPGSSWASQTIAALREIGVAPHGVPCYVDEGTHIGLNEQPFWYAGALVVYHMGQNYTPKDLNAIASRLTETGTVGVDFQLFGDRAYSGADQFELLIDAVHELIEGRRPRFPLKSTGLLGPDAAPPAPGERARLDWFAFRDATRDVFDFIKSTRRVPARVFVGADAVPPADFLAALACAWDSYRKNGKLPLQEEVVLGKNLELLPARQVAKDTPDLFGGWIIHKEGFRAPKILEVARLQAWTLKPALRNN